MPTLSNYVEESEVSQPSSVLGVQRREFGAIRTREIRSNVSVNTC